MRATTKTRDSDTSTVRITGSGPGTSGDRIGVWHGRRVSDVPGQLRAMGVA